MSAPVAYDRLTLLARASVEAARYAAEDQDARKDACRAARATVADDQRTQEIDRGRTLLFAGGATTARPEIEDDAGQVELLMKERAALQLQLETERAGQAGSNEAFSALQKEHGEAQEALRLQQGQLRELRDERSSLLKNISDIEAQLRKQVNETEQVQLKFEKLKGSRQVMSDQATDHAERIAELESDNERLRVQLEQALRERDKRVAEAAEEVAEAREETGDAFLMQLWQRMHKDFPEVFVDTHTPTRETFEHLCNAVIELVSCVATIERHVHQSLKDLRQVGEQTDKLNHFYIMFTKNPGLFETFRDYVITGKRKNNCFQLLRAQQTWARAFATGLYKVIVRSPVVIGEELNTKDWPIKTGFTVSEEAAIGKYYKETASKQIPEKLGTRFRRHAAAMVYEDYADLMTRR